MCACFRYLASPTVLSPSSRREGWLILLVEGSKAKAIETITGQEESGSVYWTLRYVALESKQLLGIYKSNEEGSMPMEYQVSCPNRTVSERTYFFCSLLL